MQAWHAERDRLVGLIYQLHDSIFRAEEIAPETFLRLYHAGLHVEDPTGA